jgi:uncharacterized protein (TIGR03086 family)
MGTEPLEMAVASTRAVLARVTPDQLGQDTPCSDWKVRDLINHIVGGQFFFISGASGTKPSGDEIDYAAGDYVTAFDEASRDCIGAFQADGVLEKTLDLPFGEMTGGAFMGLATSDTLTHGWDLAKATGQDTDLAPELAEQVLAQSRASIQPAFRSEEGTVFGPEQQAPEGASNADRLAAFLGRKV